MRFSKIVFVAKLAALAGCAVTVRKTNQPPTGYEVMFRYTNATASKVLIGGGLLPFTDQYHTTPSYSAAYDPYDYRPGDFWVGNLVTVPGTLSYNNLGPGGEWSGYVMKDIGGGEWVYTAPFPSGTYTYAFLPDCDFFPNCTAIEPGVFGPNHVVDPENPPFKNVPGEQIASVFQVPYDDRFQHYDALDLNFDYALPVPEEHRGIVKAVNYTSPGSTYPSKDVHDFALYLPAAYDESSSSTYPVLYLSHGGNGNAFDWPNLGKAFDIMDRLIMEGWIEPTVVICPNFYSIGCPQIVNNVDGAKVLTPHLECIRRNYIDVLVPYVESTWNAGGSAQKRAFAGLSDGGLLAYEMYINATSHFGYYGMFSGALGPLVSGIESYVNMSMVSANPALADRGVFVGFGNLDIGLEDCRLLQLALEMAQVGFISRFVPWGSHYWNTWQDTLWYFGRVALWKDRHSHRRLEGRELL